MIAACQALHPIHWCVQAETGRGRHSTEQSFRPSIHFLSLTLNVKKRSFFSKVFQSQELSADKSSAPAAAPIAGESLGMASLWPLETFLFFPFLKEFQCCFMCSCYCHVKYLHKKKSDLVLVGEPLTGNLFFFNWVIVWVISDLFISKEKLQMTQFSL